MAVWPSTLPCARANTFQEGVPDNLIRTQMDTGYAKVRRRSTVTTYPISFSLVLTYAQVGILKNFYINDIADGADSFDYTHPLSGDALTVRFTQAPSFVDINAGRHFTTDIQFEVIP